MLRDAGRTRKILLYEDIFLLLCTGGLMYLWMRIAIVPVRHNRFLSLAHGLAITSQWFNSPFIL